MKNETFKKEKPMFQRIDTDIPAIELPLEWRQELKQSLLNVYGEHCLKNEKTFDVYAFTYPAEILIIASFVGLNQSEIPVTLFLSADLNDKTEPRKLFNNLLDNIAVFFDQYFQNIHNEDWDEFIYEWQEEVINRQTFYYKVTRENIALSLEAERLLNS